MRVQLIVDWLIPCVQNQRVEFMQSIQRIFLCDWMVSFGVKEKPVTQATPNTS